MDPLPFHTHTQTKSIDNRTWGSNNKENGIQPGASENDNGLCSSSDARRDVTYIRMDIRRNIVLYVFIKLKYVWKETFEETEEVILTLNENRPKEMDYA